MNKKMIAAAVLVIVTASGAALWSETAQKPEDAASLVGRYQLLSGVIESNISVSAQLPHKENINTVFKIDTVTGKTWAYQGTSVYYKGGSMTTVFGWTEIKNE